jgi:aspartate aminotransferase
MTYSGLWVPDEHLNQNLAGLSTSATIAIQQLCRELSSQDKPVFWLGLGQSPFPVPEPVVRALQENAHQKDYLPVKGLPELRRILTEHHKREFGIDCSIEDIIIGPGSKELMFILQLVYDGEIIIPMPAWVSYLPQARIVGRPVNTVMTTFENGWKITPGQIDGICRLDPTRARLLILNYPSNPTGQTYSRDELEALSEVCRKYKLLVLSDEIYAKTTYEGSHESLVNIYPEGTIFSGGLSKWCGAGGWRLGLFAVPSTATWLSDAMATVASETFTSTSAPIQYAALSAFTPNPALDIYVEQCRAILHGLSNVVMEMLSVLEIKVHDPQGGFYVFPDFEPYRGSLGRAGITTGKEFCSRLLTETGVAILPGSDFGRPKEELSVRIAFVDFNGAEALNNYPDDGIISRTFIGSHCSRTIEAVRRIVDWVCSFS